MNALRSYDVPPAHEPIGRFCRRGHWVIDGGPTCRRCRDGGPPASGYQYAYCVRGHERPVGTTRGCVPCAIAYRAARLARAKEVVGS